MSRLFWVRHGPTHAKSMVGWSDLPADLSDTAALTRLHDHLPPDAVVVSSDLVRAAATADAITGQRHRLPHETGLREIHFGDWELQGFDTIEDQDHLRRFWEKPGDIRPPGGESWNEVTARVDRVVARLLEAHPARDLIVVAHMGVILSQVQKALGVSAYDAFSHRIDNLSVTELQARPKGWHAAAINHRP